MSTVAARFKLGEAVRVRFADPPGHIRTPFYVRGKRGWIEHYHGAFPHPEELAYARSGLPETPLYMVGFRQEEIWGPGAPAHGDKLFVDVFESWLEPVDEGGAA
ncbi:MAG: nitrile hydratase subunit beta [Chloroflexi bacterium]|nr:nitrile hydratase subunit beta [Chloroflexota bacterium]